MDENIAGKKNKGKYILKYFIIVIAASGVLIGLFSSNLLWVGDSSLKNGTYLYTGTGNGEIVVSDDCQLCFRNFDLNENLKGPFYTQDLNSIFLDKKNKFTFSIGGFHEYNLINTFGEEGEMLQLEYRPWEDKLVLLKPGSDSEFTFVLQK